ncbi:MAG: hypothetical protein ACSW8K_10735 [bacterium]
MRTKRAVWILVAALIMGLWGCGSSQPVTVTVDRSFTDLETQEDCDRLASEKGYESVALSEDASRVTYVMSQARHKELMKETGEKIDAAMNKMVDSEDFNFESITVSDDYMTYEAVLDKSETDLTDQLMALTFYYAAEMYRQFAGMESASMNLTYKDREGKVLYEETFDLGGAGESKEPGEVPEAAEEVSSEEAAAPGQEETSAPAAEEKQEEAPAPAEDLSSYHQMLAESDDFKAELTGIDLNGMMGYTWNLYLENNTDKTLMYAAEDVSVDGIMCDSLFAEEVAPGKKANASLSLLRTELNRYGITDPTVVEMKLKIYDSNDWLADPLFYETVRVAPHGEEAVITKYFTHEGDTVLVDNDSIGLYYMGTDPDALMGYAVYLGIENRTSDSLTFSADNVSVNGYMCEPYWTDTVAGGKIALSEVTWMKYILEGAGIEKVGSVEMDLTVYKDFDIMNPVYKGTVSFSTGDQ